jgi:nitrite reductase (NADH) small subunit
VSVDVARASDVAEGSFLSVEVDGVGIALTRWNDEIFAIRDRCAHQQGSFCRGFVRPALEAEIPGGASVDTERGIVICPWHRWEYDLRTGVGLRRERFRIRTYAVQVVDDRVLVDLRPRRSAA